MSICFFEFLKFLHFAHDLIDRLIYLFSEDLCVWNRLCV